jgi:lysophosphatidiate acyltransferase
MTVLGYIRYVTATVVLTAAAPIYFLLWAVWKAISLAFPAWVYQAGDDFLYSMYQRMVVFFFEHCTRLKVCGETSQLAVKSSVLTMYVFAIFQIYLSGDVDVVFGPKENVMYMGNHQSTGKMHYFEYIYSLFSNV